MTNKEKALELIRKYTTKQKSGNGDLYDSVILLQYAKKAVDLASKTNWFYPSKNEFPQKTEEVIVCFINTAGEQKTSAVYDKDDNLFYDNYDNEFKDSYRNDTIIKWCYLPAY